MKKMYIRSCIVNAYDEAVNLLQHNEDLDKAIALILYCKESNYFDEIEINMLLMMAYINNHNYHAANMLGKQLLKEEKVPKQYKELIKQTLEQIDYVLNQETRETPKQKAPHFEEMKITAQQYYTDLYYNRRIFFKSLINNENIMKTPFKKYFKNEKALDKYYDEISDYYQTLIKYMYLFTKTSYIKLMHDFTTTQNVDDIIDGINFILKNDGIMNLLQFESIKLLWNNPTIKKCNLIASFIISYYSYTYKNDQDIQTQLGELLHYYGDKTVWEAQESIFATINLFISNYLEIKSLNAQQEIDYSFVIEFIFECYFINIISEHISLEQISAYILLTMPQECLANFCTKPQLIKPKYIEKKLIDDFAQYDKKWKSNIAIIKKIITILIN